MERLKFRERLLYFKDPSEEEPDFYQRLGLTASNWSYWKDRDVDPPASTVARLAEILKLSETERSWLAFGDTPPPPKRRLGPNMVGGERLKARGGRRGRACQLMANHE